MIHPLSDLAYHMMDAHAEFERDTLGCMVTGCYYTSKNKNYLREHIAVMHTNYQENTDYEKADGLFLCTQCDETKKTLAKIRRHIFTTHTEPAKSNPTLTRPESITASTSRMSNSNRYQNIGDNNTKK